MTIFGASVKQNNWDTNKRKLRWCNFKDCWYKFCVKLMFLSDVWVQINLVSVGKESGGYTEWEREDSHTHNEREGDSHTYTMREGGESHTQWERVKKKFTYIVWETDLNMERERRNLQNERDLHSVREEFIELCCGFAWWKWDRHLKTVSLKLQVAESKILVKASMSTKCLYCCYEALGLRAVNTTM